MTDAHVEVALPQLGVRLGNVHDDTVQVRAADLMGRGEAAAVVLVPVFRPHANGGDDRYRFCRLTDQPRQVAKPGPDDIGIEKLDPGESILIVLTRASETAPQYHDSDAAGRRMLDIKNYPVAKAPRTLWVANDVLSLLLYGELADLRRIAQEIDEVIASLERDLDADRIQRIASRRARLAEEVAVVLDAQQLERCVVTKAAVDAAARAGSRSDSAGPGRAAAVSSSAPDATQLYFALGSCQYSTGMIDGTPLGADAIAGPADKSYSRLAALLRTGAPQKRPQLLVLTGDQIYVDATAGLFDPAIADGRFRRPYEQFYSSPYVQQIQRQIPICMMLDDHEIGNNWEADNARAFDLRKLGRAAYVEFQRDVGPLPPPSPPSGSDQGLWCAVTLFGFEFFFADTRTERERRTAGDHDRRSLLGSKQWNRLEDWLINRRTGDGRPRFVVSASMLIPRRLATLDHPDTALTSDAWDGYPLSQHRLFDMLVEHRISDVIFLSGDEHLSCVSAATCRATMASGEPIVVRSVHCSGLYTPYAFANAIPEDFAGNETAAQLGKHAWRVRSQFYTGQGFAVLGIEAAPKTWEISISFDLDTGAKLHELSLPRP